MGLHPKYGYKGTNESFLHSSVSELISSLLHVVGVNKGLIMAIYHFSVINIFFSYDKMQFKDSLEFMTFQNEIIGILKITLNCKICLLNNEL